MMPPTDGDGPPFPALLRVVAGDAAPVGLVLLCALRGVFLALGAPLMAGSAPLGRASAGDGAAEGPAMLRGLGEGVGGRLRGCWKCRCGW